MVCYFNDPIAKNCIPGSHKMMVDSDGIYHICEKMDPHYDIGNVEIGLDFEKIANHMNRYAQIRSENCSECTFHNICPMCYTNCQSGDGLQFSNEMCDNFLDGIGDVLALHYELKAINADYIKAQ